jgi:hypothetical protein
MDVGQSSRQLPGMSRGSSVEPEKAPLTSSSTDRSQSPCQASSAQDTSSLGNRFSSMSSHSTLGGPKSPLPMKSSQRFGPPAEALDNDQLGAQRSGLLSSHVQPTRDRPASPTKGLGGFVQSAMMKRSDSVNKRWSAQAAPGLSRGNSLASHRGTTGHAGSIVEVPKSPPPEIKKSSRDLESSPSAKSRPTSSHSTSTVLYHAESAARPSCEAPFSDAMAPASSHPSLAKNGLPSKSVSKEQEDKPRSPVLHSAESLPISPSKTLDPKRWSPTKASWLESALARPESPKLMFPKPQTPSWMADLQKSKLSKEDSEPAKSPASSFSLVSPAGLMRSPPPGGHARPLSIGGLPEGLNSGPTRKQSPEKPRDPITEDDQSAQPSLSTETNMSSASLTTPPSDRVESPEATVVSEVERNKEKPISTPTLEHKSPPPPKPKPHTPPKTDFRANLRSRQNNSEESASQEPEFKNVFGKLKRTQTKNYIAPDELKDNIMRGKAALNLTGGPQKSKRVDEFKESILKRKESMNLETSLPRRNLAETGRIDTAIEKPATLPEALAKRKALNRCTDFSKSSSADTDSQAAPTNPHSLSVRATEGKVASPADKLHPIDESTRPKALSKTNAENYTATMRKQEHAKIEQAFPRGERETGPTDKQVLANNPISREKPTQIATEAAKKSKDEISTSKLAIRLNPSLASIISRGPTSATGSMNVSAEDVSSARTMGPHSTVEGPEDTSGGPLTHMTKARPRGPRRRLPKAARSFGRSEGRPFGSDPESMLEETPQKARTNAEQPSKEFVCPKAPGSAQYENASVTSRTLASIINNNERVAQPSVAKNTPVARDWEKEDAPQTEMDSRSNSEAKQKSKPVVAAKSPALRKVSSPPLSTNITSAAKSGHKQSPSRERKSLDHANADSQNEQEKVGRTTNAVPQPTITSPRSNSASNHSTLPRISAEILRRDLPKPRDDVANSATSAPIRKPTLSGLGLKLESRKVQPSSSQLTPPPEARPTKASDAWETSAQAQRKDSFNVKDQVAPQQPGPEVGDLLGDFFHEKPRIGDKAEVDTQAIILNRANAESKSKVLRTLVWQINADGKKEKLPPQQEHILFEDCMYLCAHSFATTAGSATTEVYLWAGDRVSEAAMEDAQLFGRREARENNAKLELLRQGKEPAKFFQALGGIVITRRSRTSSLYMLCGRRHLGHVAFDEVDLDAASLCSGFPYLMSAKFGKLYLWKGRGSGADEVGCARLIGMDLGLTGEIEEVEEGKEPPSFLESFSSTTNPQALSQQWSLRSRSDRYGCRLFSVEVEQSKGMSSFWTRRGSSPAKASKASVKEIYPFCQTDLHSRGIFVLDAYFNIFV